MNPFDPDEYRFCTAQTYPGSPDDPPEYCENEAEVGSEFCYGCDPDGAAADHLIDRAEDRREEEPDDDWRLW